MKLLVGLGNPGGQYQATRHNVGWMALDRLADERGFVFKTDRRFRADLAETTARATGERVVAVKPLTYMNESGAAVQAVASFYKVPPEHILVITDDMALPLGLIRVRPGGSAGGHNGMRSLIRHLGTTGFPRVRIGVGAPVGDAIGHVLGAFGRDEWPAVHDAVSLALQAVDVVFADGIEAARQRFNRRVPPLAEPEDEP